MIFLSFNILTIVILALEIEVIQSIALNQSILIEHFGYSQNSVFIDLSQQNIDSIHKDTFNEFNHLEELYFENNKLNKIEDGTFNKLTNLRELWLESNNIVSVDRNCIAWFN